jgi:hypothetical protein
MEGAAVKRPRRQRRIRLWDPSCTFRHSLSPRLPPSPSTDLVGLPKRFLYRLCSTQDAYGPLFSLAVFNFTISPAIRSRARASVAGFRV